MNYECKDGNKKYLWKFMAYLWMFMSKNSAMMVLFNANDHK